MCAAGELDSARCLAIAMQQGRIGGERFVALIYRGGLQDGKLGRSVFVDVTPEALFVHEPEGYEKFATSAPDEGVILPLADITGLDVDEFKRFSPFRAAMLGLIFGFLWKRSACRLTVYYTVSGIAAELLLEGRPQEIDDLRRRILAARSNPADQ